MSSTKDMSLERQPPRPHAADDWPELISSSVLFVREGGQWSAVLTRFSIVGVGGTRAEAWQQMDELAHDYLELCEKDQLPWREVVRPMPVSTHMKLVIRALVLGAIAIVLALLRREHQPPIPRDQFVVPHLNGRHAQAC